MAHLSLRTSGEQLARGALQSVVMGMMRTQNLEWLERFSVDRSCQFCQAPKCAELHDAVGGWWDALDTVHAGGPLIWAGRAPAHRARARRVGRAPCERLRVHGRRWQRCSPTWNQRRALRTHLQFFCALRQKERDGAKPLLVKIQSAEKRIRTRQNVVESATTKRDLSVQNVQDKVREALTQRREQEVELMAADLLQVSPTLVPSRRGVRRS